VWVSPGSYRPPYSPQAPEPSPPPLGDSINHLLTNVMNGGYDDGGPALPDWASGDPNTDSANASSGDKLDEVFFALMAALAAVTLLLVIGTLVVRAQRRKAQEDRVQLLPVSAPKSAKVVTMPTGGLESPSSTSQYGSTMGKMSPHMVVLDVADATGGDGGL